MVSHFVDLQCIQWQLRGDASVAHALLLLAPTNATALWQPYQHALTSHAVLCNAVQVMPLLVLRWRTAS